MYNFSGYVTGMCKRARGWVDRHFFRLSSVIIQTEIIHMILIQTKIFHPGTNSKIFKHNPKTRPFRKTVETELTKSPSG